MDDGPDFDLEYDGSSVFLLTPMNDVATDWANEHVDSDLLWCGVSYPVETGRLGPILEKIKAEGFSVEV